MNQKEEYQKVLLNKIKKMRKEMLKDCWLYHSHILKEECIEKSELHDELYEVSLEDWEDVGFFIGYLRCLDDIQSINKEY